MSTEAYFVIEGNDVRYFRSRDDVEGSVEAYDIDEVRLFTVDGTQVGLARSGYGVVVTDRVIGRLPEDLGRALRAHLLYVPRGRRSLDDGEIERASLADLVGETIRIEKPNRKPFWR